MICVNGTFCTFLTTSVQLHCLLMCIMLLMHLILNMERLASYVLVERLLFGSVLQCSLIIKVTFDFRHTVCVICHCVWAICKSAPRPRQIAMPVPSSLINHNRKFPSIFANFFVRNSEIHTHNTRSANDLHLSCVNSLRGVRCVEFKASLLWNNLHTKLKQIKNLCIFKKQLTNFVLFEDASD